MSKINMSCTPGVSSRVRPEICHNKLAGLGKFIHLPTYIHVRLNYSFRPASLIFRTRRDSTQKPNNKTKVFASENKMWMKFVLIFSVRYIYIYIMWCRNKILV